MLARAVLASAAALLALAPAAGAATVSLATSVTFDPGGKGFPLTRIVTQELRVAAAPGEANRVAVALRADGALEVTDAGAALAAGSGCTAAEAAVACALDAGAVRAISADLGDGDDVADIRADSEQATIVGGAGDDMLAAVSGVLEGGEGDDVLSVSRLGVLRGGPGADRLAGGAGRDTLDGGPGTDDLDGGEGRDLLSYAGRAEAITVDLAAPTAGAAGEADRIAGLEDAAGGDGPDVLRAGTAPAWLRGEGGDDALAGGPGADELDGGPGADALSAAAGDDRLDGGTGDDRLDAGDGRDRVWASGGADVASGGPGDDSIADGDYAAPGRDVLHGDAGDDAIDGGEGDTADGGEGDDVLAGSTLAGGPGNDRLAQYRRGAAPSRLDCGTGRDTVVGPRERFVLPAGCELVDPFWTGDAALRVPAAPAGRTLRIRMPNPCLSRCRVHGALFAGGRHVGTVVVRWPGSRQVRRTLRWRLSRADRRALAPGALLRLRLVKRERGGSVERGGFSVVLR